MISLSLAQPGAFYTIKWNTCTEECAALTAALGLRPGNEVFLVNQSGGSVIVRVEGKRIALGKEVAARIKV